MALFYVKKLDWLIIGALLILAAVSLLQIYSLSQSSHNFAFFTKQAIFFVMGFLLMFIFSFLDYRFFKNHSGVLIIIYFISLFLLFLVLWLGQNIRGATAWFNLGFFNFQPIEITKLVIVLLLAKYFSQRHIEMYRLQHLIISGFYIFLPGILVLVQPDFGSFFILVLLWVGLIILAGINPKHLLVLLLIGAILFAAGWFLFLKEYQKQRILNFLNPQKDPLGYGYSLNQSLIAIGSAGFFGKGLANGGQAQLGFLPEAKTDFIFAAFAEEWGFVGALFLLIVFGFLFSRLIKMTLAAENNFSRIFCIGFALMLFSQLSVNLGSNLGLLPITGLSLPFLSYGGSNLIINFIGMGIFQNIVKSHA